MKTKLKLIVMITIIGLFYLISCDTTNEDIAYNPSDMPAHNAPGNPNNPYPAIHTLQKGEGPIFRWHRPGNTKPYLRTPEGGGFCVMCHGDALQGSDLGWSKPPSCYTCHDKRWSDEGKDTLNPKIGTLPPSHDPRYLFQEGNNQGNNNPMLDYINGKYPYKSYENGQLVDQEYGKMPNFNPPLSIHRTPKPPPRTDEFPELGHDNHRWHKQGFYGPLKTCGPQWTCKCCHGSDDLTGTYIYPDSDSLSVAFGKKRTLVTYIDPADGNNVKYPPSCYTCHNRSWDD